MIRSLGRLLALVLMAALALQLYFAGRIALMNWVDPQSTTFQRSEIARLLRAQGQAAWSQQWVDGPRISDHLRRAVIASEDARFVEHGGVEWEAIEKAWARNQAAQERATKKQAEAQARHERAVAKAVARGREPPPAPKALVAPPRVKIRGGSTISQQLAKNLFFSAESNLLRKGQELVVTFMLETLLDKRRILTIYLNNVEWGEGVFGAQAAARHYHGVDAKGLSPRQAARLAVMLPAPRRYERQPNSPYLNGRSATIAARMRAVELP